MWALDFREFSAHCGGEGRATHLRMQSAFSSTLKSLYRRTVPNAESKTDKVKCLSETQGILLAMSILKSNKNMYFQYSTAKNILILKWRNGI